MSVASAGDVNGDGIDDLVIGAPGANAGGYVDAGASYVVFGKAGGFDASFDLASLATGDGSTGFVINGVAEQDKSGVSVASAGDVNGDGIDDLIIGAVKLIQITRRMRAKAMLYSANAPIMMKDLMPALISQA